MGRSPVWWPAVEKVAVVGAGSWGTTVAHLVAQSTPAVLWARREEVAGEVCEQHTNERYLAGFRLHPELRATADLAEAVSGADVVVMGVPSHGFRATLTELVPALGEGVPVISLAKGLEQGSNARMTEIVQEVAPGHPVRRAHRTQPRQGDPRGRTPLPRWWRSPIPRWPTVCRTSSPPSCSASTPTTTSSAASWAAALKNVIAIASGMADGLGTGDNTRAAVITRGLAEITGRLGVHLGGDPLTFAGLAGMGDLIATCIRPRAATATWASSSAAAARSRRSSRRCTRWRRG